MYWETLPSWIWVIYYLFLLLTLGTGILNVIRKRMISVSILAICLVITVPVISLVNSIGRAKGVNELEHLVAQLQQGAIWSIYTVTGTLFLFVFWILLFIKNKERNPRKGSNYKYS
ncbi:hypothetical protein [Bacillus mesophilum]|uniref:Uncharacterized protein n=1 Tax=Bacillus mesophilum TaxID=1071718 RepID=A0A7V7RJZ2_9BACI|nr:hypothetical protein [Bacillus mesophilum]KAB2331393.1 hypothetical protein F7732_16240 [Bacillus mesophilum]